MSTLEHRRNTFAATFRKMANIEFWDDWKPWIAFVTVGLFFIGGWGIALNAHTLKKDAVRNAAIQNCMSSRPLLRKFDLHIRGVNEMTDALLLNSKAIVQQTPHTDPQYRVRVANLHRLQRASVKVGQLRSIHVPTEAECKKKRG